VNITGVKNGEVKIFFILHILYLIKADASYNTYLSKCQKKKFFTAKLSLLQAESVTISLSTSLLQKDIFVSD
jgi:hypothetical protein